MRFPIALLLLVVLLLTTGCESSRQSWVDGVNQVITSTVTGAVNGGPLGALTGMLTGIGVAVFGHRRAVKKVTRRERVIETYRRKHGSLSPEEYRASIHAPPGV